MIRKILTILITLLPFLSFAQVACGEYSTEDIEIVDLNCEADLVTFCIGVPIGEGSILEFSNNGVQIDDAQLCGIDTTHLYSFAIVFDAPPFELVSWEVNGMTLSGNFDTLDELVNLMNELHPEGNWQQIDGLILISETPGIYGDMIVRSNNNLLSTLAINLFGTGRFGFDLPIAQNYNFEVLNTNENCVDNIDIELDCEFTSTVDQFDESNFLTLDIYPNPVGNEQVQINYELAEASNVQLELYNAYGQLVELITNNKTSKEVENSISYSTTGLQSGVYFLKFTINDKIVTRKLVKS